MAIQAQTLKLAPAQSGAPTTATYGALPATGFVRLSDLRPILPFSDSTLWRRVRNKTFPAPLKLSEKITCWRVEEVRLWLDEQGQVA